MTQFKQQQVAVATYEHGQQVLSQQVRALVLGDLAIHKPLCGGGYVITHIPSGYKLADAWKQKTCKTLVANLIALGINWRFDPAIASPEFHERALPLIRAFISNPNN